MKISRSLLAATLIFAAAGLAQRLAPQAIADSDGAAISALPAEICPEASALETPGSARADGIASQMDKTLEGRAVLEANTSYWNSWACTQGQRQGRDMNSLDHFGAQQAQMFLAEPETSTWLTQVMLAQEGTPTAYTPDQIRNDPGLTELFNQQYKRGGLTSQGWGFPFVEPAMP